MKKFLSILLSISMVLGLLTSTAYANNVSTKHSATKFESIGHGEFRIAPSNSIASDEVEDVEIGKVIIAYPTNDEETVSYTHLDVYKRQPPHPSRSP